MASSEKIHIVMIHGFRGTHHGLQKIAESFPADITTHIPDLPGFGQGESLDSYSLEAYVSWLHRYVKALHLSKPPVLLGHSFGSIISAAYAAKYPTSIEKLILVNPIGAPALEGPKYILTKLAVLYYKVGSILPERLAHQWLSATSIVLVMSTTMAKTRDKKLRKWIHDQHLTYFSQFHSAKSVLQAFETSVRHSVRDDAESISVPTLLIIGEKDDITPPAKQHELHRKMKLAKARLHSIPDVGHLTHYETPEEVARVSYEFIKSL